MIAGGGAAAGGGTVYYFAAAVSDCHGLATCKWMQGVASGLLLTTVTFGPVSAYDY
jgi:hypothetical protein